MNAIIKSIDQQQKMDKQGYITLPLLPQAHCQAFKDIYTKKPYKRDDRGVGFHTGLDQEDSATCKQESSQIVEKIMPALRAHLSDFQVITATFIIKEHGTHNFTAIHQDWTFVDEEKYNSYTLWCPLQDTDLQNGTLGLLPGSHDFLGNAVRPSPSPPYVPIFKEHMMEIFGYLDFLTLSAGQAILFDHRTWHGALPNISKEVRIAIGVSLAHKDANLTHHYLLPNSNQASIFAVDSGFYYTHSNKVLRGLHAQSKQPSGYEVLNTYGFEEASVSSQELLTRIKETITPQASIMARLEALFPPQNHIPESPQSPPPPSSPSTIQPLWKVYTPKNIYLEIKHRLSKRIYSTTKSETTAKTMLQEADKVSQEEMSHAVGTFYDLNHEAFTDVYGTVIQAFRTKKINDLLDYELKSIGIKAGDTVLDAGCGVCGPAMYFSTKIPCCIHAMTISERQYKQAAQVLRAEKQRHIHLYHGDFHHPTQFFKKDTFDRIYFLESFGHSLQKKELLATCWEVLKPGGIIYIKDLFRRIAPEGLLQSNIDASISRINSGYCYAVNDLEHILNVARKQGYIIQFIKTLDIGTEQFEDLSISNHFQELTGINRTEDWDNYIFPVDFMELRLYKPIYASHTEKDKYFMQQLMHVAKQKVLQNEEEHA